MAVNVPSRLCSVAVLGLCLTMLSGCQKPALDERAVVGSKGELQKDDPFVQDFQAVLYHNGLARNAAGLSGVVELRMTLDAHSRVLDCTASSRAPRRPQHQRLVNWVTDMCWNSLFPPAPPAYFADADATRVVQVAVRFSPRSETSYEKQQQRQGDYQAYQLSRFFREHVVTREPIDSIGVARFNVVANAQGQVSECQIDLAPSAYRALDFKSDRAFAQRLSERCQQLDLRQMPGFASDAQGRVSRQVTVEYSPWLKRLSSFLN